MYEIRCVVGDKKLREVLIFLNNNNTLEPPVVIPTGDIDAGSVTAVVPVNTTVPKPAVKQKRKKPIQAGGKHLKGKGATEVVRNLIQKTGVTRISAREMSEACLAAGYSKGAYSHAIKILTAEKAIRSAPGLIGEYYITNPVKTDFLVQKDDPYKEVVNAQQ